MKQLAIIIPAYKDTYLKEALESIAAQTCQNFTLYIGDDCSPYDLESIINEYKGQIDLQYKRFKTNLGGKDLVAQWERCIALSKGEPYIWLFSDDDRMEPECVQSFINLPEEIKENYLIHFNVRVIDMNNNNISPAGKPYPQYLTAKQYLDGKLFGINHDFLNSYVVEFIFSRKLYNNSKGFQSFDLAWGSDFLTWVKMAGISNGIFSLSDNICVQWRKSNENISPDKSHSTMKRKLYALIENAVYIQQWLKANHYQNSFLYSKFFWGELKRNKHIFSIKEIEEFYKTYTQKIGYPIWAYGATTLIKIQKLFKF